MPVTVLDVAADPNTLLPTLDDHVRALAEAGGEAHAILVGPEAYEMLKVAVAERFGREVADLSQYQWVPVVVDPFRGARVCVVPAPRDIAAGVRAERA